MAWAVSRGGQIVGCMIITVWSREENIKVTGAIGISATDAQPLAGSGGGGFEGSFYGGVGTNDNNYHDLPPCPPQDVIHVRPPMIFVIYVTSDIN